MTANTLAKNRADWTAAELAADKNWTYKLDDPARADLLNSLRRFIAVSKDLLTYRKEDFDLGSAKKLLDLAFNEAKTGRGLALVKGLPRESVSEREFELLTWAIGLHYGVARPQGAKSQYISPVRNEGTDYRSSTGRGYSSNAKLDYHTDSADIVVLSCYNQAPQGGQSMVLSALNAYRVMTERYPDLVGYLHEPVHFSRQGEFRPGEAESYPHPIFDIQGDSLCVRWNRNRVVSAQKLDGVPKISATHWDALEKFDALLHDPQVEYTMFLEPGDMQLLNSHVTLHARTDYVDHDEPSLKRLLFRLWLAPPDSVALPESWKAGYRCVDAGAVRGGILGREYDLRCTEFDQRQASALGMEYDAAAHR
jgi:hypothetical protein